MEPLLLLLLLLSTFFAALSKNTMYTTSLTGVHIMLQRFFPHRLSGNCKKVERPCFGLGCSNNTNNDSSGNCSLEEELFSVGSSSDVLQEQKRRCFGLVFQASIIAQNQTFRALRLACCQVVHFHRVLETAEAMMIQALRDRTLHSGPYACQKMDWCSCTLEDVNGEGRQCHSRERRLEGIFRCHDGKGNP